MTAFGYRQTEQHKEKIRISRIGFKHTEETKQKISKANKGKKKPEGKKLSQEHKNKIAQAHKGKHKPPLSKEHKEKISWKGRKHSDETKEKIRNSRIGKKRPREAVEKMRNSKIGKKLSNEHKEKIKKSLQGDKCYRWKGGVSKENNLIRARSESIIWRKSVFKRDNFTCQKTGNKKEKLNAHHILNFSDNPDLRYSIDNGITLSQKAHIEFHKKYGKQNNTLQQLLEFLLPKPHVTP